MVYRHTGVGTDAFTGIIWTFSQRQRMCIWIAFRQRSVYDNFGEDVIVWRFSQRQRMCIWIAFRQRSVYEDFGEDVHTAMAIMMMELIWAINGIPSYRRWNRCVYGNNMDIFAAAEDVYLDSVQAKERL